jgi:hypothetical protein
MAKLTDHVQLEQSDMLLALNMTEMATERRSRAAISISHGSGLLLEQEPNRGNGFTTCNTQTVGIWAGFHLKTHPLQAQISCSNKVFEF